MAAAAVLAAMLPSVPAAVSGFRLVLALVGCVFDWRLQRGFFFSQRARIRQGTRRNSCGEGSSADARRSRRDGASGRITRGLAIAPASSADCSTDESPADTPK